MTSPAVVLSGGGVSGIAWAIGVLSGLQAAGVDLSRASVVGTSAGSVAGVALASGRLDDAVARQLGPSSEIPVAMNLQRYVAEIEQIRSSAPDKTAAAQQMAEYRYTEPPATYERRMESIAARLSVTDWPERSLRLAAVDATTGERTVFDASSGVRLLDAVAASCALPGIWPPVRIGDRSYLDGGIHSNTNADLAVGASAALILVAVQPNPVFEASLQDELDQLAGIPTHVISLDDRTTAAIGDLALDPASRGPALEGGRRQAAADADRVRELLS